MVRPCFIVVDPEHSASISTRKLVIESAKLNVITAYSGAEAIETLRKFPGVDGVVCNHEVRDIPLHKLIAAIKECNPDVPVVMVGPGIDEHPQPDHQVESFDPQRLLDVLQGLMPHKTAAIVENDQNLREGENSGARPRRR
jgi:DNA-binding NtrC family response regulator